MSWVGCEQQKIWWVGLVFVWVGLGYTIWTHDHLCDILNPYLPLSDSAFLQFK